MKLFASLQKWWQARQRRKRNERSRSVLPMADEDQRFWMRNGVTAVAKRGKTWKDR